MFLKIVGFFCIFILNISQNSYANDNKLIEAVKNGDYYTTRKIIYDFNVNSTDEQGNSAIFYAIKNEDIDIINLLLSYGANLNQMTNYNIPIYCLVNYTYNTQIQKLIKKHSNYNYNNCIASRRKKYNKQRYSPKNTINFTDYVLNWKTGTVLAIGTAVATAGGGGGGGSNGKSDDKNKDDFIINEDYNLVGDDVQQETLKNITNSNYYKNTDNKNDYDIIRLGYSLARGYTGKNIKVAVLDTGVSNTHSELTNIDYNQNNQNLACLENPSNCTNNNDDIQHGTAVASILGSPQDGNIVGIAPEATIIPYKLTDSSGNFVSSYYIGEAFKYASNAGARVINNSYGMDSTAQYNASTLKNQYYAKMIFGDNYINQMINAVKNNDTIFVWAGGNEGQNQPSINSGIPLVYKDVFYDNETGYYKNFITSVAYDTVNNTLADYSNKCGVAKEYCITAPGTDLIMADSENNNGYIIASGTSFSAPVVSGTIAVLKQAFSYMSGAEITKLLFTTARDLGEKGVDEIYGWGMLDLERATRPVGVSLVPISESVKNNKNYSLNSSTIEVNSLIANNLKKNNLKLAFVDDFSRTFKINLNDVIQSETESINTRDIMKLAGKYYKTQKIFNNLADLYLDITKLSYTNYTDLDINFLQNQYKFNLYFGNDPYMAFVNNKNNIYNKYNLIKSYDYNSLNPYFRNNSEKNLGLNIIFDISQNLKFNIGAIYQNYSINYSNDYAYSINRKDLGSGIAGILGLAYKYNEFFNSKVEFGIINEKGTMLGSKTDGAFNIGDNNITYFASLFNNLELFNNKIDLFLNGNFGYSVIKENKNSLIKNVSDIYSNSFSFGINFNLQNIYNSTQHNISLLITQPITIRNGDIDISLPVDRNQYNYIYENHNINLKNKEKYDTQISYNIKNENYSFSTGFLFRDYLENENIIFLKFKSSF